MKQQQQQQWTIMSFMRFSTQAWFLSTKFEKHGPCQFFPEKPFWWDQPNGGDTIQVALKVDGNADGDGGDAAFLV